MGDEYSMREWQRETMERETHEDREVIAPGQYSSPYPGVADTYVVLDFSRAPEAQEPSSAFFTLDPSAPPSAGASRLVREGSGGVYQLIMSGFVWVPDVEGSAWKEYWICARRLSQRYLGFEHGDAVAQLSAAETDAAAFGSEAVKRHRLVPQLASVTFPRPMRLDVTTFSICSPAGPLVFPRMTYVASIAHGGGGGVIALGAGHGVGVGDLVYARNGVLRQKKPQGSAVTAADDGAGTVTVAHTEATEFTEFGVEVVIGSRWIRVPVRYRALVAGITNFTAP